MGKSFDDYPTIPRIDTDGVDDEDIVDRAREKQRFQQLYRQMTTDQKNIIKALIRVCLSVPATCVKYTSTPLGDLGS
jgi:hypothetical protein